MFGSSLSDSDTNFNDIAIFKLGCDIGKPSWFIDCCRHFYAILLDRKNDVTAFHCIWLATNLASDIPCCVCLDIGNPDLILQVHIRPLV
ncbi:MAG TPA: hypothetical protein VE308_04270 [Nitrososphaera sp.]|nr:hypothetical protein [Nitrososphaera sp.]